jgi:hypothetical protein
MVMTRTELVDALQHEVRVLLHLTSKIDRARLDYRPTPKQRSTIELLRYLSLMGPEMIHSVKKGGFDVEHWVAAGKTADGHSYDQTLEAIGQLDFRTLLADVSDTDFRREIEMFGNKSTVGAFLVTTVLCGYAAYRTQLFNYLKAYGREELTTSNLWRGADPVATP